MIQNKFSHKIKLLSLHFKYFRLNLSESITLQLDPFSCVALLLYFEIRIPNER